MTFFVDPDFRDSVSSYLYSRIQHSKMENPNFIKLPTNKLMPIIGFGTWQANDSEIEKAVEIALETGLRHIDTAVAYENEGAIGKVLKKWLNSGKVKREELFIVSKLPASGMKPERVEKWMKYSLKNLQLDYLDLYLIHVPFAFEEVEGDLHPRRENGEMQVEMDTDLVQVWKGMEKQVEAGRTRAIGVSNFNKKQMKKILDAAKVPLSNLQIELHLYFQQKEMVEFCKSKNISITAYMPLGNRALIKLIGKTDVIPSPLEDSLVQKIAENHGKTPAQVLIRFIIQNGIATIPKSTNRERIQENFKVLDWELTSDEMDNLRNLDKGSSARICDFAIFKGVENHPEFPFA